MRAGYSTISEFGRSQVAVHRQDALDEIKANDELHDAARALSDADTVASQAAALRAKEAKRGSTWRKLLGKLGSSKQQAGASMIIGSTPFNL